MDAMHWQLDKRLEDACVLRNCTGWIFPKQKGDIKLRGTFGIALSL